ncbi:MAG: hypothetical protein J1F28_05625 [Oscillospiraceae bacterium]|nr:hypothetical protein [Oscillospiraceae bacterium]
MFGFAKITEQGALARVLLISREVYAEAWKGNIEMDLPALLDLLSKVLSHCGDESEPVSGLLKPLKLEFKEKHRAFYRKIRKYFGRGRFVPEYDYDRAFRLVPLMLFGNDRICEKLSRGEPEMAKVMCDAMKSCPGYIFNEFGALSSEQFYDLVFGFYPKLYGEEFMEPMKYLFEQ